MPIDPFSSTESRDNWLRTNIPREVWELPVAQVGDFLRNEGISISNQRLADIRRDVLGIEFRERQIRGLADEETVPVSWLYDRHGYQMTRNFQFRFEFDARNRRTGEVFTNLYSSLSSDSLIPVGASKELMKRLLELPGGDTDWIVERIELRGVLVKPGLI